MTGSFFKTRSEKRVQRVVKSALPSHLVSVELVNVTDADGRPETLLAVHVEGSNLLGSFSAEISPDEVFPTMQTIVRAAAPAADYPLRCSVSDSQNQQWLYD